jgi:NADH-quinone oxidoreductase subunit H
MAQTATANSEPSLLSPAGMIRFIRGATAIPVLHAGLMFTAFSFMFWVNPYAGISYLHDIPAPRDMNMLGGLMWIVPIATLIALSLSLWMLFDERVASRNSRLISIAGFVVLSYYLLFFLTNGLEVQSRMTWGFWLVGIGAVGCVLQGLFPRKPVEDNGTPKVLGIPTPLFIIGFTIANFGALIFLAHWETFAGILGGLLGFIFEPSSRVSSNVIECRNSDGCSFLHPIIYSLILIITVVTGFAYTTLLERKLVSWFQSRVGPNRVGPWGLLQPAADGIKLIFKENILPAGADKWVYRLAPILKAAPTLIVLAVIPLGPPIVVPWFDGNWYRVPLGLSDPGVGVLWLLAITSIGTYGVVLAGWASNNKYSMLGGMRASAQMVSYELSMGLTIAVPVLIVGTMTISTIVDAQSGLLLNWLVFQNPLAAGILVVALFAETNRAPFDLPEAEQELTAGYMTEYSGMKFALFMMAEYLGMIAVSLIAISLFFGGYHDGFGLVDNFPILAIPVILGKLILFLMFFVWVRATLPRIRYDRLMNFGWKVMLPLALLSVVWSAVAVIVGEELGPTAYIVISGLMFVAILAGSVFFLGKPSRDALDTQAVEDDPIITGSGNPVINIAMTTVGALLTVPFALYPLIKPLIDLGLWFALVPPFALLSVIFSVVRGKRVNLFNSRVRFNRGLVKVLRPLTNLAPEEPPAENALPSGSGD